MSKKKDDESSPGSSEEFFNLKLGDPYQGLEDSLVGTIFVNREYRIKSIISSVTKLINLSSFDEDLEINDFARQLKYEGVTDDIKHVFKEQDIIKKEVKGNNGRWYLLELRPHVMEDENNGVVITFVDVTELKETEEELAEKIGKIKELQRQIIKNDVSERWRIGQFMHDDLGQTLVSAKMLLKSVKDKLANGEKDVEDDVDQLIDIISESSTDVRDVSHEIVPLDVEEKGITYAFNSFARQMEKMYDLRCDLEYDNTVDNLKNMEIATHLYRIAQEASKNAADHGKAENIRITLKSDNDYLYLNIEDDGIGFSDSAKKDEGMGISIMRHRMELIGGTLEIKDTSVLGDTGATINCRIPTEKI